jgi:hypothetical protein
MLLGGGQVMSNRTEMVTFLLQTANWILKEGTSPEKTIKDRYEQAIREQEVQYMEALASLLATLRALRGLP